MVLIIIGEPFSKRKGNSKHNQSEKPKEKETNVITYGVISKSDHWEFQTDLEGEISTPRAPGRWDVHSFKT